MPEPNSHTYNPLMPRFGPDPGKFFAEVYTGPAPWDIGAPQPALVQLFNEFPLEEPVLDAGSGSGDMAIWIAKRGLRVIGVDLVPAAVELAQERAASDNLAATLEFRVGDARRPSSLGVPFGSVVDSGFYHLFEPDACERYAADLHAAIRPHGRYYVLAFAVDLPAPDVPRGLTDDELLTFFAPERGWKMLALRQAEFVSRVASTPAVAGCFERLPD